MTKQDLERTAAWRELGPTAPLRFFRMNLCAASRESYHDPKHQEAIILRGSSLGFGADFSDRRGLEINASYYHAQKDSIIICRKDGKDYKPKTAVAQNGYIVLV